MNPSSNGWIHKFINEFSKNVLIDNYASKKDFYLALKNTGFIYGVSVSAVINEPLSHLKLTKEEYTKVNLFHALLFSFYTERPHGDHNLAIDEMVLFYKSIDKGKRKFFQKLSITSNASEDLEKILSARLLETNTLLKKDAASLLTYSLLYVDVLAFQQYLKNPKHLKVYLDVLENSIVEYSIKALQSKKEKNKYDYLVIEMVRSTGQFTAPEVKSDAIDAFNPKTSSVIERQFLLDICCLATWDDRELDEHEYNFLTELTQKLQLDGTYMSQCIDTLQEFSLKNATKIKLFEYVHPVKQFYKQSSDTVNLLILRNKNRLIKELNESGELLVLLTQSTHRELSAEEKTKVKDQVLDICKTIPSLTIFLLPGGTLLLPLFVKLIPKLLPSAFQDNRVDQ